MNIMPMDYYPMSAGENSQIKTLEEEKQRLNGNRQAVNESRLSNSQKENINDEIGSKTDNIKNSIHREDQKKAQKEESEKAYLQRRRENSVEIKKQAENMGAEYKRFDEII